jgi:TetR/AcrR family transcriptional regulator
MTTPAQTSTRQERRKARTRAAILDAAEEFFASADSASATIAQIADAADVAVATVYQHFAGKDDLHLAVVERALEKNERHMMAVYDSDAPAVAKLIGAVRAYLAFYLESPPLFRLVALRQGTPSEESSASPVAVMLSERVDRMTRALAGVVEQGIAEGTFREVDPLDTARFAWGAMNGVIALAQRPDRLRLSEDELRSALAQGAELLAEGLLADPMRGPDGRLAEEFRSALREAIHTATAEETK